MIFIQKAGLEITLHTFEGEHISCQSSSQLFQPTIKMQFVPFLKGLLKLFEAFTYKSEYSECRTCQAQTNNNTRVNFTMEDGRSTIRRLLVNYQSTVGRLSVDCRLIVDRYIGRLSAYMSTEATYSTHDPEMGEEENKFTRKGGRVVTRNFRREGGLRRRHLLQHLYYLHFYSGFFIGICLNIC